MSSTFHITGSPLALDQVAQIIFDNQHLSLSPEVIGRIDSCRDYLDRKVSSGDTPVYGVNTGFGSLCNHSISTDKLEQLQVNLVRSHACGTGNIVSEDIVRLMLLLKVQALSYGHSGVQHATVDRLTDMFNHRVLPVVYEQGSLGASGDLSPLAHLSLPLLGEGQVVYKGKVRNTDEVYRELGWSPVKLRSKEGLALLNGTQYMSAIGVYLCIKALHLSRVCDITGAMSLDAFDGCLEPFHPLVHDVRPHPWQQETARNIGNILKGSQIADRPKEHVQDPYSFRTIPQVHGASKEAINHAASVIQREVNSVTDNPTVFPEQDLIVSAGNFHGQPLALVLDYLAIGLSELGSISERRTYQLLSGKRGLPHFLVANPGLNSGFMIPQYTSASIVSQNKQLCTPSSVDTIDSSQGQEDHVSMGANGANKAMKVAENLEKILAIELFNAAQALEFRKPLKSSPFIQQIIEQYRTHVPFVENDQTMYPHIQNSTSFIRSMKTDMPE